MPSYTVKSTLTMVAVVTLDGWVMGGWMSRWMGGWVNGWIDGWVVYGWMGG